MLQAYLPVGGCWPGLAHAVALWAQRHAGISAPDMSSLSCIVPDWHHAALLRQALQARVQSALLPPRIYTLESLASEWRSHDGASALSETTRLLTVYAVLRQQDWAQKMAGESVANGVFWPMARQLLQLCDELSSWFGDSPDTPWRDETGLQAWLQQHFGARASLLSFEAHLLLKVWHALRDPRNPTTLMQRRLSHVPQDAPQCGCRALCWVIDQAWEELPPWQRQWAQSCAHALPFQVWHPVGDKLMANAQSAQTWQVVACSDLEQEALSAARTLLALGQAAAPRPQSLALIAQDVAVARRVQALLHRAQVPVQDETGWKLSTSAAATVLMRWIEASQNHAPWNTVLEVIKSPFVKLAPETVQARLAHVADMSWRATLSRQGWSALYDSLQQGLQDGSDQALVLDAFQRLANESRRLHRSAGLGQQIQGLLHGMQALGLSACFEQDAAGMEILHLLQTTAQVLSEHEDVTLTLDEFQAWLSLQFETCSFRPATSTTQTGALTIHLVSLAGARLRPWDAVVWVGAGADVMQAPLQETLFFGTRVRHELGLQTRAQAQQQMERHLLEILSLNVPITLTWRARQGDEPLALAPLLARLQLAAQRGERDPCVRPYAPELQICSAQTLQPQARVLVDATLLPTRLSARAWQDLVACPYRFWVRAVWRLDERDDIQDTVSKRDYGNAVHSILYHAHRRFEQQPEQDFAVVLQAVADEIFTELEKNYPDAFFWQQYFDSWKTFYLPWWQQQREQGWRWQGGELQREFVLPLAQDRSLTLYGRLDRLDRQESGQRLRVLDYKAQSQQQLQRMQRQLGEEVQLLFYGLLCLPEAEQHHFSLNAAYLPVQEVKKSLVLYEAHQDEALFIQAVQAEKQRLQTVWLGLVQDKALLAQGHTQTCRFCSIRGLCRRDERETAPVALEPEA
jgi:ATP-dependent helicase/nuclease subunit B